MIKLATEKFFQFIADNNCEHCGSFSRTALCSICHQELMGRLEELREPVEPITTVNTEEESSKTVREVPHH